MVWYGMLSSVDGWSHRGFRTQNRIEFDRLKQAHLSTLTQLYPSERGSGRPITITLEWTPGLGWVGFSVGLPFETMRVKRAPADEMRTIRWPKVLYTSVAEQQKCNTKREAEHVDDMAVARGAFVPGLSCCAIHIKAWRTGNWRLFHEAGGLFFPPVSSSYKLNPPYLLTYLLLYGKQAYLPEMQTQGYLALLPHFHLCCAVLCYLGTSPQVPIG